MDKEYVDKLNLIGMKDFSERTQEEMTYYLTELFKINTDEELVTRDTLKILGYKWTPFNNNPDDEYGEAIDVSDEQQTIIYLFQDRISVSMYRKHMRVQAEIERPCKYGYLKELFNFMCHNSEYVENIKEV